MVTTNTATQPRAPTVLVPTRLDDLVLARLAFGPKVRTAPALAKDLSGLSPPSHDPTRWEAEIADAVTRLERRELVRAGSASEPAVLDLSRRLDLPSKAQWKTLRSRTLPGLALGVRGNDSKGLGKLQKREQWAAAIVGRALGLWEHGGPPRVSAICDALVWRSLRLGGNAKRTPPEIRAHFLVEILSTGSGPPERLLPLLAAREVDAPRADLPSLRDALIRRWLCGAEWNARSTAPSIADFASAVGEAANRATEGLFGGRKVFISSLWQGMRSSPAVGGMSLDEFKQKLVAAHKAGLVALARADLTAAMDPRAVRESETSHLEARYHFVERGGLS